MPDWTNNFIKYIDTLGGGRGDGGYVLSSPPCVAVLTK
jgi:hypothetical protein